MRQIPLGMRLQDRSVFSSFLVADNAVALAAVQAMANGSGDRCAWLQGPAGSGKSHLLQALCAAVPGSAYFPLAQLLGSGPEVLEGADQLAAVALDDLHLVVGDPAWERRLFALYNDCDARAVSLLIAARQPATGLGVVLADLRSRLASMPHFALRLLDEAQQREALQLRAAQRGLELPDETVRYLQRRYARDMTSMQALLDRLDAASLEERRRLTVPLYPAHNGRPALMAAVAIYSRGGRRAALRLCATRARRAPRARASCASSSDRRPSVAAATTCEAPYGVPPPRVVDSADSV